MLFSKKSISDLLVNSKLMINVALSDDEIKNALVTYNYTEEVLNQGKEILAKARDLARQYTTAAGKKSAAADEFKQARRQAQLLYIEHLNFLRQAYRDEPVKLVEFKIPQKTARKVIDWLFQVGEFYSTILSNEELLTRLARYGISREKVEVARDQVNVTSLTKEKYNTFTGKTQSLKVKRDRAFRKLDLWTSELALVCRYALQDDPQQLEKLGIQVLSEGYRRKKKEDENADTDEIVVEAAATAKKTSKKAAA